MPSDVSTIAGLSVTLPCAPPASVPEVRVVWYKDLEVFQERTGPFAATQSGGGDLVFSSVQLEDAGEYFCVAINRFAYPTSRSSPIASLSVRGMYFSHNKFFYLSIIYYVCSSKVLYFESNITIIFLSIFSASPIIVEPPVQTQSVKGGLLTLYCIVKGNPTPSVEWLQDNVVLQENSRIQIR